MSVVVDQVGTLLAAIASKAYKKNITQTIIAFL